jgi:hypothetical protein
VQSLYAVINFKVGGGGQQVYTTVMWKIVVPPRVYIFLWLLANNKTLTRDTLAKRKKALMMYLTYFVLKVNQLHICSLNVAYLKLFGNVLVR